MSDELEVQRLILTYARAADRLDGPLCRSVFADDADIRLGRVYQGGPDGFVEVMLGFMGQMAATRHQVSNMLVAFAAPDRAALEAQVTAWHRIETPAGTRVLEVFGRYLTRAEKREGAWRITAHAELIDWGEERAADAGWYEADAEMEKGRRDRDDASYSYLPPLADAPGPRP